MPVYTPEQVQEALSQLHQEWVNLEHKLIQLHTTFASFDESMSFVNHVAKVSQEIGNIPDIHIHNTIVVVEIASRDVEGLLPLDFELARRIEALV